MIKGNLLLYGANGFSAKLILQELIKLELFPILAGRNFEEIKIIAKEHNLDFRVFNLNNLNEILINLDEINIVLNCAGPFINTIKPLLTACLEKGVHYLDITGEIGVFEITHSFHEQALEKGIIICPGVGFDVVPTDCLALMLKERFSHTARNLELAFHSQGGPSKGTALTSLGGSGKGSKIRREGKLITVPYGKFQKDISFPHKTLRVNSIPWGDVFTAYISTNIPNITVYMAMHPKTISKLSKGQKFLFLRNMKPIKWFLIQSIKKRIKGGGPSQEIRKKSLSYIWGYISDGANNTYELFLKTPNSYDLTALTSAFAIQKVFSMKNFKGYFTPSQLFGSKFILEIPGTELIEK
jgi:short subunit dehydrogenase-like uncharacterized protein